MGWIDEQILPEEMQRAVNVADAISRAGITKIFSSPLQRARQTAAPLADRLSLPVNVTAAFGELHMGPWEGLTQNQVAELYPAEWAIWRNDPASLAMPGRETLHELKQRVGACFDRIVAAHPEDTVTIYSHDTVVRVAILHVLDLPLTYYRRVEAENCSVSLVEYGGAKRLKLCHLVSPSSLP